MKLKSKLAKYVGMGMLLGTLALPVKANAQTRPINQPTPLTTIGNVFRRPYINYEVGKDSSDFYDSNGIDWDTLKTKQERISLLEKILPVEYSLRQTQSYKGDNSLQAFINLYGISNVNEWAKNEEAHGGNVYDSTSNAYFNLPASMVETYNQNNHLVLEVAGILVGEDPLKYDNWYFFDPKDSNKTVDLSNSKYVSINSDGYIKNLLGDKGFTFIPDIVKFELENKIQKDTIMVKPYIWRNSPNTTTFSLTAPNDTTIYYKDNLDLLNENLGDVKVQTNLKLGKDFDFQTKNEYTGSRIIGELYIREISSLQDTVFLSEDKKSFKVKEKTIKELVEKNTIYNTVFPNGNPWEHVLKKDSVYQNIRVDKFVGINDLNNSIPKSFEVYQNYPNPFNPSTTIKYELPNYTPNFSIKIYDLTGKEVRTLKGDRNAGTHEVKWNGLNEFNQKVSSGVYLYRVIAGKKTESKKMILLK